MVVGLLLVGAVLAPCAVAQTYFMYPGSGTSVSLEVYKPKSDIDGQNFMTSVFFLSGNFRATDRLFVRAELPIANADIEVESWLGTYEATETLIGNPYVGVEFKTPLPDDNHQLIARFGIRPPFATDDKQEAWAVGALTSFDRVEAFWPDCFSVCGGFGFTGTTASGVTFSTNVGGVLATPAEDYNIMFISDVETEFLVDYDFSLWVPVSKLNLGFGASGRVLVTQDYLNLGERTMNQLCMAGNLELGQFRPGFHFRAPINEYLSEVVDYVYGLNFTYQIK